MTNGESFPLFSPACQCPLVMSKHFGLDSKEIRPASVEDYVSNAIVTLTKRNDIMKNGRAATAVELQEAVLDITLNELKNTMPTIFDFRTKWKSRFTGTGIEQTFAPFKF